MKRSITLLALVLLLSLIGCKEKQPSPEQNGSNSKAISEENLPIQLSDPRNIATCVYLTKDAEGTPYISWVETDSLQQKHFFFARFDEEGKEFGEKREIPIEQNAALHEEGMPKLAVKGNGDLFALYETSTPSEGQRFGLADLRYLQSLDGGSSWSAPKSVAPEALAKSKSSGFAGLGRLGDGEIGIIWLGSADGPGTDGRPVKFARTKPDGSIGESLVIDPGTCQCCRTAVTAGENGEVYVAYRNLLPGSIRDISMATSIDTGKSFQKPVSFSNDQWKVEGCPHNGPSLVAQGTQINATWFTDADTHRGVNYAILTPDGTVKKRYNLSSTAQFIQNDFLVDGTPVMAYNESYNDGGSYYSRIVVARLKGEDVLKAEITPKGSNAFFPVVTGLNAEELLVGWREGEGIMYKVVEVAQIDVPEPVLQKISFNE